MLLTTGIFIEQEDKILYESSIPLRYIKRTSYEHYYKTSIDMPEYCFSWKFNDCSYREYVGHLNKFGFNLTKNQQRGLLYSNSQNVSRSEYCYKNVDTKLCLAIDMFKGAYDKIDDYTIILKDSISFTGREQTTPVRTSRALDFIGNFFEWCCGLITKSDIEPLYVDQTTFRHELDNLGYLESSDHNNLKNFSEELLKFSHEEGSLWEREHEKLLNMSREYKKITQASLTLGGEIQEFWHFFGANLNFSRNIFNIISKLEVIQSCESQRIPRLLIQKNLFKENITQLEKLIEKQGYELTIGKNNIDLYYRLPLARCKITTDSIFIEIKIPIRKLHADWKLFTVKCLPFVWENKTCKFCMNEATIAKSRHRTVTLTNNRDCESITNKLCQIPRASTSSEITPNCVKQIFEGGTAEDITRSCVTQCYENNRMQILQLRPSKFIITHPIKDLTINCGKIHHVVSGITKLGSLEVTLPCNCSLNSGLQVLIPTKFPCENDLDQVTRTTHLLPASFSKFKTLSLDMLTQGIHAGFQNITKYINEDELKEIPHVNLKTMTNTEDFGTVETKTHKITDWYHFRQNGESFLTITTFILILIIIFKNPYLVGIVINTRQNVQALGPWEIMERSACVIYLSLIIMVLSYLSYKMVRYCIKHLKPKVDPEEPKENKEESGEE